MPTLSRLWLRASEGRAEGQVLGQTTCTQNGLSAKSTKEVYHTPAEAKCQLGNIGKPKHISARSLYM